MIIADDFGLDPAHDRVIIELLRAGNINGTSVMVSDRLSDDNVTSLKELRTAQDIQIGLHLNLTEAMEGISSHGSILALWIGLLTGSKDKAAMALSFKDQLARFEVAFGFAPDFMDGHQHCHAIYQNWSALKVIARSIAANNSEFWVRSPAAKSLACAISECRRGGVKSLLVMWWGENLRRRLIQANIATNSDFSGLIPYGSVSSFEKTYRDIMENRREDCLVMVHPGAREAEHEIIGHSNELRALEANILTENNSQ